MTENSQVDNQLYEWSLKNIILVAGAAVGALIAKGIKTAVNSATVKANKGKLDKILNDFKEKIYADVEKRAALYQEKLGSEEDGASRLTKEKKRAFQKALLDYVKKEISALGKKIEMRIEKAPAGKRGKESLKVYWETITTSVELDLIEKLHKLDIIGEEEREVMSDRASADLEKIINIFLKKFGKEDETPRKTEFQQLQSALETIENGYNQRNEKSIEEIEDLIEKIDLWKEYYEKAEGQLSDQEKKELKPEVLLAKKMEETLVELREDLIISKRHREYIKTLYDYMETLFDNRSKYIKSTFDLGTYQEYKDKSKMKDFVRFIVGEVMDRPEEYEKQDKILQNKTISDKQLVVLFLKVFLKKFERYEEEKEDQNEGFVSFYDYIENHL
jgi:uncharacterized membrane-anchored protein YhcB (DUF1043 family)